ncbi:MAG: choice-of-anchor tandem repeat NxxGxxAF-containing protein, partial [Phycisphaerales bacterium]
MRARRNRRTARRRLETPLCAVVAAAGMAGAARADLALTTLLQSGAPAPVGEAGVVFDSFIGAPALAAATGELLVRARLAGPTVDNTNDIGIFVVDALGQVSLLAREGDHAPGLAPSVRYANLNTNFLPTFNALGDVVFPATLTGGGYVDGADLGLLLSAWGPCAGACPADLNGDGVVDGSDLGLLLGSWGICDGFCQADLTGEGIFTNNDSAVFAGRPGAVQALLQEGDPAPGIAPAGTKMIGFSQAVVTNSGLVGVRAAIQYPPAPNGSGRLGFATWVYESPTPTLVAASELPAPGFDPGLAFSTLGGLSINSNEVLSFVGGVFNPITNEIAGSGVWGGAFDAYNLLAGTDDPAPGTEAGTLFRTFTGVP